MAEKEKKNQKISSKTVKLNTDEAKKFLYHIISNNRHLQEKGKNMVSTEVVGDSGIGKTSIIKQIAQEQNLHFIKLNLAQIEELGDLVGFPIRQFKMSDGTETAWVDENMVEDYRHLGYKGTGQNRMSYCPPEWIAGKEEGGILLLDDWNRADMRFIQAVMELVDRQEYISWKLPKNWHIILTANPDNQDYLVNSIDVAQKTRFVSVDLKFDIKCWSVWAEQNEIDTRCIDFLLLYPETVTRETNARSITTFFNAISSLKSFEDELPLIQMIGEGSVGPDFAQTFTTFINNKLDKLVPPDTIMHGDETWVLGKLKSLTYGSKSDSYRADIASTIGTRIVNYSLWFAEKNAITKQYIQRLSAIIDGEIFNKDVCYHIVKSIYTGDKQKFQLITMDKKMGEYAIK